jgi:hypothetical protein
VGLRVRCVFLVWEVKGRRTLELVLVSINHLIVDCFLDDSNVGVKENQTPNPKTTLLAEMLRLVALRLEVKVLTLVVPLVSNVVPNILVVRFQIVCFCHTSYREGADIVGR